MQAASSSPLIAMTASTSSSVPASKKRCWVLMFKDIKNLDVEEAGVLSSFRKRYTSVKNLAIRSPAAYDEGVFPAADDDDSSNGGGGSTACVEVQFTGPQPIEGPAGLLCTLLQGTFVKANPVQLGRGRKRKIQAGSPAPPASSFASAPGGSGTRSFLSSRKGGFASSGNFDFRLNRTNRSSDSNCSSSSSSSSGANSSQGCAATKAAKNNAAGHDSSGNSASSAGDDTASIASTHCHLSSASSASSVSSLEDLFGGLLEESTTNDSAATFTSSAERGLSRNEPPARPQPSDSGGVFPAFRPAYGGEASEPASATDDTASGGASSDEPGSASHLCRSGSVISIATDDLPKWDDVVRCVDSSSPSCSSTPSSASSPSSPSEEGQRWPSINSFGDEDSQVPPTTTGAAAAAAAAATTDASTAAFPPSLPPPIPSLAAGNSYYECKEDVMSQEEALSLFTTESAATATTVVATAAPGGAAVSEDGLSDMPPDGADSLFGAHALERHTSSHWGLVHASAAVVTSDDADDGGDVEIGSDSSCAARAPSAVEQQRHHQQQQQRERRTFVEDDGVTLPSEGHQISFEWCKKECDFDGRPAALPRRGAEAPPRASSSSPDPVTLGHQCHFTFQGLQSAIQGYEVGDLVVRAQFSVDSVRASTAEKVARHLEVDARGDAHATVTYPSMLEIWPEMYDVVNIRVIEVDMVVEIRSVDRSFVYTGPALKVTYRRPATQQVLGSTVPMSRQAARVCSTPVAAGLGPRRVSTGDESMFDE